MRKRESSRGLTLAAALLKDVFVVVVAPRRRVVGRLGDDVSLTRDESCPSGARAAALQSLSAGGELAVGLCQPTTRASRVWTALLDSHVDADVVAGVCSHTSVLDSVLPLSRRREQAKADPASRRPNPCQPTSSADVGTTSFAHSSTLECLQQPVAYWSGINPKVFIAAGAVEGVFAADQ